MLIERPFQPADIEHLIIAGWTGRDQKAVEHHIKELEALGVKRPRTTPIFYRAAASLLTTAETIEVLGGASSGEIEPVVVALGGELWVGVGSDHTDREAEAVGVSLSKQMCAKPVSATLWRFADVADHWDDLILRSHAVIGSERRLYQEGTARAMRPVAELIKLYNGGSTLPDGTAMFCGTFAAIGGVAPADRFEMELHDPHSGRSITAAYSIRSLPIEG
ncbi:DUF2848 domain-containing protein [uncultured Bosea sp.]|uniref:DUF2848 domain-containing protein n=1 Tax=uncultured Bosea sp. TaxID=211457 RepID=UPI0025DCAD0A|nr:DUF2848 domain-containing protein [uncultured Bosea sp.]